MAPDASIFCLASMMSGRFSAISAQGKTSSQSDLYPGKMPRRAELGGGCPPVVRLGLATRGNTHLCADDVALAVERGLNYLNWCGYDDGIAQALRLGRIDRGRVVIAMQLDSRDATSAWRELEDSFRTLGTGRIDVVTFYYVEHKSEWRQITGPGGALEAIRKAKQQGRVRLIGLTTHQRELAAECAPEKKIDLLMVRYNAAHRGAVGSPGAPDRKRSGRLCAAPGARVVPLRPGSPGGERRPHGPQRPPRTRRRPDPARRLAPAHSSGI